MSAVSPLPPRPQAAPPARWRFPAPEQHRLDNGVKVYLHHLPGQHAATVICHLGIPLDTEPDGCDGIAAVMAASLGKGPQGITGRRFEQEAGASGITWKTDAGYTGPVITLEAPAAQLAVALDLLRLALAEPVFEPAQVTSQIQRTTAGLIHAAADPQTRVKQELPAAIYGDAYRAGQPADGTPGTVASLTPDAIAGFYDTHVRPATTTVVIAGDLTGLDAAALVTETLTTWHDGRPAGGAPQPEPLPPRSAAAILADQPGAVQTQLLLAVPVPGRGQPGWNALQIAAHILGAPTTGQLDARLQKDAGHSYGIGASLTELVPGTGLLMVSGAVAAAATISALRDIKGILTAPLLPGAEDADEGGIRDADVVTRKGPAAGVAAGPWW